VRPEVARADRAAAVRDAARAWQRAGAIDGASRAAIDTRFPDDRERVGPVFRVLLFLFTLLAVNAGFGLLILLVGAESGKGGALAFLALLTGGAMTVLTELQTGRLRRRQGGTEAGTSLLAVGFLAAALAWVLFEGADLPFRDAFSILCLAGAALLAAAAWRWGYPLYAAAATAALLTAVARLPFGRLLWIALPLAAAPFLLRLGESPRLPPAHRASWTAVLLVALTGLYLAVHLGSWEDQLIEQIGKIRLVSSPQSDLLWWAAVAGTALVPAAFLAAGLRRRSYPLLLLGTATGVASLVTLRFYVHLAPLWVVLIASGALLAAGVALLRRYLDSGPDGERHGYTAAPLFEDAARLRLLEAAAAVVTLTPEARSLREEPRFEGGGGEFGGGGASGQF
jgi:hypothetical protein